MASPRWILHADMDAFYASVEQREHPELRGKPVVVGATSPRGVVTAASYEAREYGIRSAMPGFRAHELCPHAHFVRGNMKLYGEVSRAVHGIFKEFTPLVQPLSLDEAFLDVSGSVELFGGLLALGRKLKRRVREETRLPVSVGIAPSKLVAKIACTFSKPDGLLVVPPEAVITLLRPLPVGRLWGVGPVLQKKLDGVGIRTIADLSDYDPARLRSVLGDRASELQRMARGIDSRVVESSQGPKSIGEENTFERDVTDREIVTASITSHAETVAGRARKIGYRGRTITLKMKLARRRGARPSRVSHGNAGRDEPIYPVLSRSRTLRQPTSDGARIRAVAIELWDEAKLGEPVRLLGVTLSGLVETAHEQLELFGEREEADRLGAALDTIREKFGSAAIGRAVDAPMKISPGNTKKRGE